VFEIIAPLWWEKKNNCPQLLFEEIQKPYISSLPATRGTCEKLLAARRYDRGFRSFNNKIQDLIVQVGFCA